MRALRWYGAEDVRIEEVPDAPLPRNDEVRIAVSWCGICGTDAEEYRSGPRLIPSERPHPLTGMTAPITLGHEVAGRVIDVGRDVRSLEPGDLVALDALMGCGECWWCRRNAVNLCPSQAAIGLHADGGLADMVTVPATMCVRVPDGVGEDTAALAEPLAVAVHGIRRGRLRLGETLAIVGAGMIGLATIVAARAAGAAKVVAIETDPSRRETADRLGADLVVDPAERGWHEAVKEATMGRGTDVAIEAAGSPLAVVTAVEALRAGGRAVVVGLSTLSADLDLLELAVAEKELIGSLSHVCDEDLVSAVDLLASGVLTPADIGAVHIALEDVIPQGFAQMATPPAPVKVLVSPAMASGATVAS